MAVNKQFSTIHTDYERYLTPKQIVVQCNLDATAKGGIKEVCFSQASVQMGNTQIFPKQIKTCGKVNVKVVFLNEEGQAKSFDYISDFTDDITDDTIVVGMSVDVSAVVVDSDFGITGNEIKVQTVVELRPKVIESVTTEFLHEADNILKLTQDSTAQSFIGFVSEQIELSDEFDTGVSVTEILLFDCKAMIDDIAISNGKQIVCGQCYCSIIYLSDNQPTIKHLVMPFAQEIEVGEDETLNLRASIKESRLMILGSDAENVLRAEVVVEISGTRFRKENCILLKDVYSTSYEIEETTKTIDYMCNIPMCKCEEKISGSITIMNEDGGVDQILCSNVVSCALENILPMNNQVLCEGLAVVNVMYVNDESLIKNVQIEIPYTLTMDCKGLTDSQDVSGVCILSDLNTKLKRGREIEIIGLLQVRLYAREKVTVSGISDMTVGQDKKPNTNAITIYIPTQSQTSWDIAKALGMPYDQIAVQNPNFDCNNIDNASRIVVYREL